MILTSSASVRTRISLAGIAIAGLPLVGCFDSADSADEVSETKQAVGSPSVDQEPLDPTTIPQFTSQLPIPRV